MIEPHVSLFGPSSKKGRPRNQELRDELFGVVASEPPMSVRQVFYQAVSRGLVAKTEGRYREVGRLLTEMRRERHLPYRWIADATRWMRKPRTYSGLRDALEQTARTYRRALWEDAGAYIEVWLEKEALAGVIHAVTDEYDVPLMVTRGYASESYLYSAAETIRDHIESGDRVHLYYFGDRDPSGEDIPVVTERRLREMVTDLDSDGDEFFFERVAVTTAQMVSMNLPARPTKATDTRARNFKGESVELDAIPPGELRRLVRESIELHIEDDQLERLAAVEKAERASLEIIIASLPEGQT